MMEKNRHVRERRESGTHVMRTGLERRMKGVESRKALLQTEKVCRLAMHNDFVKVRRAMHQASNDMLTQHLSEKQMVFQALALSLRLDRMTSVAVTNGHRARTRRERIRVAREEKKRIRSERAAEALMRVEAAASRRDNFLAGIVEKAVSGNSPRKGATTTIATQTAITVDKLEEAQARREIFIAQRAEQAGMHNQNVMDVCNSPPKGSYDAAKVEEANVRRELLLAQRKEQACIHNQNVMDVCKSPPVLANGGISSAKVEEANFRREQMLAQRKEQCKKYNENVDMKVKSRETSVESDFMAVRVLHNEDKPLPVFGESQSEGEQN